MSLSDILAIKNNRTIKQLVPENLRDVSASLAEIAKNLQVAHYDPTIGEYVNLAQFWNSLRNGKIYTTEFNKYDVSPVSTGVKKDSSANLIMEPSTNTYRGKDDYSNIGLFMAIEVNAYVDLTGDYHVTAIEGDGRFKRDGTNGDVYTMAMQGYIKFFNTATTWGVSYSDAMHPGFDVLDEARKIDGSIRPYLLHAKYAAGRNPKDNQLASISGVYPEYNNMSHDGQISEFKKKGSQYSGKTSHDDFYVNLMLWLKYATLNSQSIMKGCENYYLQYSPSIFETDTKRFIISNTQANNLVVGSCVSIGDYNGSTKTDDRQQARNYNLANRVKIKSLEPLADGANTAVNLDTNTTFTTTATSTITTYPWNTGGCDSVLGVDGSPYNNQSGKEPFIINKIEMCVGGYEVIQNLIIYNNNTDAANYKIQVYACCDCTKYKAGSPSTDYDLVGYEIAKTDQAWKYISKIGIDTKHPSVMIPVEANASSTTGFGDGVYTNTPVTGYRVWRSLGNLASGAICGLRCLDALGSLTLAPWNILGRLSATGQSRRRAGVN